MIDGVTRQKGKYKGRTITPPSPEEILDDNFNYPDYIEHILNLNGGDDFVADFFDSQEFNPVDPFITETYNTFEEAIYLVQKQYEEDLENKTVSLDYNREMKKIAQAYFDCLKNRTTLKLQEEAKFNAIVAKMSELVTVLSKVIDIKREIETESESRLIAASEKKLPKEKLYMHDLENSQNSEAYKKHEKAFKTYRDLVYSQLENADGIQYKPIEKLNFQRKK